MAARVGEQQGGGHGAGDHPPHAQAGAHVLEPADPRVAVLDLVHGGGDVHGQVHDRARTGDEYAGREDVGQVQVGVAGIEQHLGKGPHRPVQPEQLGEQGGQAAGEQQAEQGTEEGGQSAPGEPAHGEADHRGEQGDDAQPGGDGRIPPQEQREKQPPQHQGGEHEAQARFQPGDPGHGHEQQGEQPGEKKLQAKAMGAAGHRIFRDAVRGGVLHQDGRARLVPLVDLQLAGEHVDHLYLLAPMRAREQPHLELLQVGLDDQVGAHLGVVHRGDQGPAADARRRLGHTGDVDEKEQHTERPDHQGEEQFTTEAGHDGLGRTRPRRPSPGTVAADSGNGGGVAAAAQLTTG